MPDHQTVSREPAFKKNSVLMMFQNSFKKLLGQRNNVSNLLLYFAGSFIGLLINLMINPVLALNLSHEDYAVIGYFTSFNILLSPLISFSFTSYYARNFFLLPDKEKVLLRNTLIITTLVFSLILSIVSFFSLYLYFKIADVSIPFYPYAALTVSSLFLSNYFYFLLLEFKLKKDAKRFFFYSTINALISSFLCLLFVVVLKEGAFGRLLSITITSLIFFGISLRFLLTNLQFDFSYCKNALVFCWPISLAAMLNFFFSGIDRTILEQSHDIKSLALYNIAFQIAGYLAIFSNSIGDTFQPDILQSIAENDTKKTLKILGVITFLNVFPVILFIVIAPFALKILTFDRYTQASDFARILALKNITSSIYFSISTVIIGYGFSKITLFNKIIGSLLCFYMFKLLISQFGFYGAAWGQVVSMAIMSIISIIFIIFYKNYCLRKTTIHSNRIL